MISVRRYQTIAALRWPPLLIVIHYGGRHKLGAFRARHSLHITFWGAWIEIAARHPRALA